LATNRYFLAGFDVEPAATGGPNISPDVRYAAIARLRHVECSENGYKAYTDIWREFSAIRQAMA
jgi:hypothetical protein